MGNCSLNRRSVRRQEERQAGVRADTPRPSPTQSCRLIPGHVARASASVQHGPRSQSAAVLRFPRLSSGITHRQPPTPPRAQPSRSPQTLPTGNVLCKVKHRAPGSHSVRRWRREKQSRSQHVNSPFSPHPPRTTASLPSSPSSRWGRFPRRGTAVGVRASNPGSRQPLVWSLG